MMRSRLCLSIGGRGRKQRKRCGPRPPKTYDLVLQAVGRTPNGKKIAADKAGVAVTDRGFINVDIQMRTNVPHIFAIGDIVGQPMLAHKAVHEAHVAAEVIAGEQQGNKELAAAAFNARVIPSVAYTDPEVAWVGLTEDQAKAQGIKVKKGLFPWTASGRAIANGRDEGVTKLLFDDSPEAHGHGKILGGGMVGTHAGDMIGEIALAIEMGADAVDIGKTIHPHPTLGESIGMAAEIAHGSCTDVPPVRRQAKREALTKSPNWQQLGPVALRLPKLAGAVPIPPESMPPKRSAAHYLWAMLIARIYEVFLLLCPICGGQMRIIAFITHSADIRQMLDHIGMESEPPNIAPARGSPLWDMGDAPVGEGIESEPDWDTAAQPVQYEVDQRINW
jgi:Pyridine nucleotide-disulphide oxidoreductase, dimerisation domain/Pyridine nucleotide-disulphide oxidoreductase